jgi:transcriptional regulator with XRE-family HTH domain
MVISDRLRLLREQKDMSQGDVEKRTGLLRCYVSRVENGHTVPSLETLEKFARALEVPLYHLLYDGNEPPKVPPVLRVNSAGDTPWGSFGKDARFLSKLRRFLGRIHEKDRALLFSMTQRMSIRKRV